MVSPPPGGHWLIGALPEAIASAYGRQPLNPQRVHCVCGRRASMSSALGMAWLSDQLTFIPGVAPESGASRNTPGASPLAASTMPSETPKFILRGARLATMTVRQIG